MTRRVQDSRCLPELLPALPWARTQAPAPLSASLRALLPALIGTLLVAVPALLPGRLMAQTAQTAQTAPPTLEELLKKIGGKPSSQARFVEKKYLSVLDAPVESSGVLRYQAPARLEKNTERPIKESMMIDGDQLVMDRDGRRRTIPASQFPGVAALVGGLRDTLGGNVEALRRMFKVVIQGDQARWQMDLLPSTTTSAELVNRITLRGRDDQVLEVETLQADGDRSLMVLTPE